MIALPSIASLRQRPLWFWVVVSFLAHLAVIWLVGERQGSSRPPVAPFHATLAENVAPLAARLPDYDDPQLFTLPSLRGFSGAGWLRFNEPRHDFYEWLDEQRWLPLPVELLGQTFVQHVRLLTEPASFTPRKVEPLLQPIMADLATDWAPQRSRLRVEAPLAGRLQPPVPEPPSLTHKEVLSPTVVELLVDERGHVFTAVVVAESGLPAADHLALDLARQLSFQSTSTPGLTCGQMTVEWFTLPPTNAPASIPRSSSP